MTPQRRSVRLNRLDQLLRARPDGYTTRELARLTGVSMRSVQRDLLVLQTESGLPLTENNGRYALMKPERLAPLDLNVQEARALMIATRLFLRYSDEGDPFGASALRRLAGIMPEPVRDQVRHAADALENRPLDADFSRNLSVVTDAWAKRRSLRIAYRSAGRHRARESIVDPYFLEPSAPGFSTYLIAYSRTHASIRTFKVERIVAAEMLPQSFELPADLDLDALLRSAWGIVWGEGQAVKLRFTPQVAWRVKETHWHPSQAVEDLPDGGCLLTLSVASAMEVGRWVRSWGDQVEVLAPASLRQELREEAVRLARQYASPPRAEPSRRSRRPSRPGSVA
ncbi:MAG TPA: WYL domain-containing protein [Dehalococcoidia bacterium]|nr:WYL domain-containing protein [Dehalococcoidia bacterium]